MYKFVALWNIRPGVSEAEFERWYSERHMGDAQQIPGLVKYTVNRVGDSVREASPYYRMAELGFASRESFEKAFASPEWKHAFADAQGYIVDHVRLQFESTDVPLKGIA